MMAMKKKKHQPPIGKRSMTIFESGFGLRREPKVARGEGRGGAGGGGGEREEERCRWPHTRWGHRPSSPLAPPVTIGERNRARIIHMTYTLL